MKKHLLLNLLFAFITLTASTQVGIGTNSPDSSAMLDVSSVNKGFLPPRIALTATNVVAPVNKPAIGLLVYNTATAGSSPNNVSPGYYYWNGNVWYPVSNKGSETGDMQYWNGTKWINITVGQNGSALILCNGVPTWGGCPDTLRISPANNSNEVMAYSYNPNTPGSGDTQLTIGAWTVGGTPVYYRYYLKFDYALPVNAVVTSAKISFYAMPNPHGGNSVDAHYGSANAMYIQRVTSTWNFATISWNNQPATTSANQVTIPTSTSSFQNNTDIDVTQLVKDMQANGNNGFALRLIEENYYNQRQYISSFNSDTNKRPRLVIMYAR